MQQPILQNITTTTATAAATATTTTDSKFTILLVAHILPKEHLRWLY